MMYEVAAAQMGFLVETCSSLRLHPHTPSMAKPAVKTNAKGKSVSKVARNVRGFEQRQNKDRSNKNGGDDEIDIMDVYSYAEDKHRRSKVTASVGRQEAAGDSESEVDAGPSTYTEDLKVFGSDDDEEIDSDAAFDESDEDTYASHKFGSSSKVSVSVIFKPFPYSRSCVRPPRPRRLPATPRRAYASIKRMSISMSQRQADQAKPSRSSAASSPFLRTKNLRKNSPLTRKTSRE